MNSVQIEQKSYEMPPREGISIAHFLTVADVERSARYYEKVFGARILTMGDGNAPPYLQLANTPRSVPVEENSSITLNIDGAVALITAKCFFLPNSCIGSFEVKQDDLVIDRS